MIVGVEHPPRLRHSSAVPSASRNLTLPQKKNKECISTSTTTTKHYVGFAQQNCNKARSREAAPPPPDSSAAILHPPANESHPPGREIRLLLEKSWDCRPRPPNPTLRDLICGMKEDHNLQIGMVFIEHLLNISRDESPEILEGPSKQQRQANFRLSIPAHPRSPGVAEIFKPPAS